MSEVVDKAVREVCPSCGALVVPEAELCTECHVLMAPGVDSAELEAALQRIAELAKQAETPPQLPVPAPRWRENKQKRIWQETARTLKVALGLCVVVGVVVAFFSTMLAIFAGLAFIGVGTTYLAMKPPAPRVRKELPAADQPEAGVQAFFSAVAHERWENAWFLLSPHCFERTLRRPPLEFLDLLRHEMRVAEIDDLVEYWGPFASGSPRIGAELNDVDVIRGPEIAPGAVALTVTLGIRLHRNDGTATVLSAARVGLAAQALSKKVFVRFPLVAVRHQTRWVLFTGEVFSPLDRALADRSAKAR